MRVLPLKLFNQFPKKRPSRGLTDLRENHGGDDTSPLAAVTQEGGVTGGREQLAIAKGQ